MMKLLARFGMAEPIVAGARRHAALGHVHGHDRRRQGRRRSRRPTDLGLIDITVRRNAFGRQNDSAEVPLAIPALGSEPFPAIFIRAPWIERTGPQVELLGERDGHGVMVRQGNVLGTSFHPELTSDHRVHGYFLEMVRQATKVGKASSAA